MKNVLIIAGISIIANAGANLFIEVMKDNYENIGRNYLKMAIGIIVLVADIII